MTSTDKVSGQRLAGFTPLNAALFVLVVSFATITGAWIFEWAGYAPCDLCLKQRWAYYTGVPLALLAVVAAFFQQRGMAIPLLGLLGVVFVASAVFGAYHAGVEWKFWEGPAGCTGAMPQKALSMDDFRKQLETVRVVRCDEVAIRIFGLSLAGWNAVISLVLAGVAFKPVLAGSDSRG